MSHWLGKLMFMAKQLPRSCRHMGFWSNRRCRCFSWQWTSVAFGLLDLVATRLAQAHCLAVLNAMSTFWISHWKYQHFACHIEVSTSNVQESDPTFIAWPFWMLLQMPCQHFEYHIENINILHVTLKYQQVTYRNQIQHWLPCYWVWYCPFHNSSSSAQILHWDCLVTCY